MSDIAVSTFIKLLQTLPSDWFLNLDEDDGTLLLCWPGIVSSNDDDYIIRVKNGIPVLLVQVVIIIHDKAMEHLDDEGHDWGGEQIDVGWKIASPDEIKAGCVFVDCEIDTAESIVNNIAIIEFDNNPHWLQQFNRLKSSLA